MGLNVESIRGAVTIYRHRQSGLFRVQPMCRRGRLALADVGQAIVIHARNEDDLANSVLRALDSFENNKLEDAPQVSPKERTKFIREHDSIMVVRLDSGLEITPWEHAQGGFQSNDAATVVLPGSVTETALARNILEAFAHTR